MNKENLDLVAKVFVVTGFILLGLALLWLFNFLFWLVFGKVTDLVLLKVMGLVGLNLFLFSSIWLAYRNGGMV